MKYCFHCRYMEPYSGKAPICRRLSSVEKVADIVWGESWKIVKVFCHDARAAGGECGLDATCFMPREEKPTHHWWMDVDLIGAMVGILCAIGLGLGLWRYLA